MNVDIDLQNGEERSRIELPEKMSCLRTISSSQWCFVSTVLDEWVLDGQLPKYTMVDIQGYVRDGSVYGKKRIWPYDAVATAQIFCLKGTKEEIGYIPTSIAEEQKRRRMLVVTNGDKGVEIYARGEKYAIDPDVVTGLPDTIGAGDTFFAWFAAELFRRKEPYEAGLRAVRETSRFLMRKRIR